MADNNKNDSILDKVKKIVEGTTGGKAYVPVKTWVEFVKNEEDFERECGDCHKKTRDWYENKMYMIVKDSSQPLGESPNPIPFGSLGRKYLCKECMESLKEVWELRTRDRRDDIPQCPLCDKNTHEYWDERIYGYRCVECGYMHITRYHKSWAVEDPEEREALIKLEEELFGQVVEEEEKEDDGWEQRQITDYYGR